MDDPIIQHEGRQVDLASMVWKFDDGTYTQPRNCMALATRSIATM
jgi:hypothetical protein